MDGPLLRVHPQCESSNGWCLPGPSLLVTCQQRRPGYRPPAAGPPGFQHANTERLGCGCAQAFKSEQESKTKEQFEVRWKIDSHANSEHHGGGKVCLHGRARRLACMHACVHHVFLPCRPTRHLPCACTAQKTLSPTLGCWTSVHNRPVALGPLRRWTTACASPMAMARCR